MLRPQLTEAKVNMHGHPFKISVIQTILVTHRGLNVDSPYQSAP